MTTLIMDTAESVDRHYERALKREHDMVRQIATLRVALGTVRDKLAVYLPHAAEAWAREEIASVLPRIDAALAEKEI